MIFSYTVSTPPNTTETAPLRTELPIDRGVIHRLDIGFPPGPQGLLHVQLRRFGAHLFPTNPDGNFAWDSLMQSFPVWVQVETAPWVLEMVSWNEDDTFPHSATVQVLIDPPEVLRPDPPGLSILQRLDRLLGGRRSGGS